MENSRDFAKNSRTLQSSLVDEGEKEDSKLQSLKNLYSICMEYRLHMECIKLGTKYIQVCEEEQTR